MEPIWWLAVENNPIMSGQVPRYYILACEKATIDDIRGLNEKYSKLFEGSEYRMNRRVVIFHRDSEEFTELLLSKQT